LRVVAVITKRRFTGVGITANPCQIDIKERVADDVKKKGKDGRLKPQPTAQMNRIQEIAKRPVGKDDIGAKGQVLEVRLVQDIYP